MQSFRSCYNRTSECRMYTAHCTHTQIQLSQRILHGFFNSSWRYIHHINRVGLLNILLLLLLVGMHWALSRAESCAYISSVQAHAHRLTQTINIRLSRDAPSDIEVQNSRARTLAQDTQQKNPNELHRKTSAVVVFVSQAIIH